MFRNLNSTLEARNRHFTADCMSVIKAYEARNCRIDLRDAIRLALEMHPPRYFVNIEQACIKVRKFEKESRRRGRAVQLRVTTANDQWAEIYDKVVHYRQEHPGCNTERAVAHVIAHTSPSRYFISVDRAIRLMRPLIVRREVITLKQN